MPEKVVVVSPKQNPMLGGSAMVLLFLWGWFRLEKGIGPPRCG